ncbi:MAG TPA: S1C family serine protease, partial [Chitinophagaceae bacterium]
SFGDSYQLTVNATGPGNSGGPMFDDEGNVIGLFYAGSSDPTRGLISFAVPIKYGLELMGRKKVGASR